MAEASTARTGGRKASKNTAPGSTKKTTKGAGQKTALSPSNVINDPTQSLQTFSLLDLQQYTQEKVYAKTASTDFHLFYVGRDDVHNILKYVLSRVSVSLYLNMFGYDDPELNDILMTLAMDTTVTMLVTLDKSQAAGKYEKSPAGGRPGEEPGGLQHPCRGRSVGHPPN